jgi:hypothetical protein
MAVKRMRYVGETAHFVDQVHYFLGPQIWWQAPGDEQPDHLAFASLGLLADDGEIGRQVCKRLRSLHCVVVGQRDSVETDFSATLDQLFE